MKRKWRNRLLILMLGLLSLTTACDGGGSSPSSGLDEYSTPEEQKETAESKHTETKKKIEEMEASDDFKVADASAAPSTLAGSAWEMLINGGDLSGTRIKGLRDFDVYDVVDYGVGYKDEITEYLEAKSAKFDVTTDEFKGSVSVDGTSFANGIASYDSSDSLQTNSSSGYGKISASFTIQGQEGYTDIDGSNLVLERTVHLGESYPLTFTFDTFTFDGVTINGADLDWDNWKSYSKAEKQFLVCVDAFSDDDDDDSEGFNLVSGSFERKSARKDSFSGCNFQGGILSGVTYYLGSQEGKIYTDDEVTAFTYTKDGTTHHILRKDDGGTTTWVIDNVAYSST